jgi:hypothetical protein
VISAINHIPNFIVKEDLDVIYQHSLKFFNKFNTHGENQKEFKVYTYHEIEEDDKTVLELIQDYAEKAYRLISDKYGVELEAFNPNKTHIASFENGHGIYNNFDPTRVNDIAINIFINDNYSGGVFYSNDGNSIIRPNSGDLVYFKNNDTVDHYISPITDGVKYVLPRWFTPIV